MANDGILKVVSRILDPEVPPNLALRYALELATAEIPCRRCLLVQQMNGQHRFAHVLGTDFDEAVLGKLDEVSTAVLDISKNQTTPLIVSDVQGHPVFGKSSSLFSQEVSSFAYLPIHRDKNRWGFVYLERDDRHPPFEERDEISFHPAITTIELIVRQRFPLAPAISEFIEDENLRALTIGKREFVTYDMKLYDALGLLKNAAKFRARALLSGASGLNLNDFAQAVHEEHGDRARRCVMVPAETVTFDLAFNRSQDFDSTDHQEDIGRYLQLAQGGTLVLLDVEKLDPGVQLRLDQFLSHGRLVPERDPVEWDGHLIATTSLPISELRESKAFRRSLFYKLAEVEVPIPSLKERPRDIIPLADTFLRDSPKNHRKRRFSITDSLRTRLLQYPWPGNADELRSVCEHLLTHAKEDQVELGPESLPEKISPSEQFQHPDLSDLNDDDIDERDEIVALLKEFGGTVIRVAEAMNVSRTTLYKRFDELKIPDHLYGRGGKGQKRKRQKRKKN